MNEKLTPLEYAINVLVLRLKLESKELKTNLVLTIKDRQGVTMVVSSKDGMLQENPLEIAMTCAEVAETGKNWSTTVITENKAKNKTTPSFETIEIP